jgi:energy-coupling factor transporter ATP-binding protein EcfA2
MNAINSVSFQNFRGLDELTVPLTQITMLTGSNGVGKTSVLEGLYCLFSETRLDVSPLSRYSKSFGLGTQNYNYKLFWEECPSYGYSKCEVSAHFDQAKWIWTYQKADISYLDNILIKSAPIPVDSLTQFALWHWETHEYWQTDGDRNHAADTFTRAQILLADGLYLLTDDKGLESLCRYINFAPVHTRVRKLSLESSKQLTKALQLLNPQVTDVRLTDIEGELSVVLNDTVAITLSTLGNGAVTWANVCMLMLDAFKASLSSSVVKPNIILIDEMGAGIHYSVMCEMWNYIKTLTQHDKYTQFVFTSHSDDCIRAYCETFEHDESASVVRLHKTSKDQKIVPTCYSSDSFKNIINGGMEVRG